MADRQAEDIVLLDIREVASFADYFVIATALSGRQTRALVDTLEKELRAEGVRRGHEEGGDSGWMLLDYSSVIVHIFSAEEREHYALEELWRHGKEVVRIQ